MTDDDLVLRAAEVAVLLVLLDLVLAWVQPDEKRWPRRLIHLTMAPLRAPIRWLLRWVPTGDWDISPLVAVALLTMLRVWWME